MSKLKSANPGWFSAKNKRLFGDVSYKAVYGKRTGERYLLRSTYMWSDMFGRKRELVYRINLVEDNYEIGELIDIVFTSRVMANEWLRQN